MWENTEGTIFDPYLFQPKPPAQKKKEMPKKTLMERAYSRPRAKLDAKPFGQYAKSSVNVTRGAIKTFNKLRSPSYQLQKVNRKLKEEQAREKLYKVRDELAKRKAQNKELARIERARKVESFKEKLFGKQSIYK